MSEVPVGIELTFTAHNILLPDGFETLRGYEVLEDSARCQAALRILREHVPSERARAPRVADLGCLEGGYSVAFARAAYDVTGVEARADNYARCRYVAAHARLPTLSFERADVRSWASHQGDDHWHAVYCGGLLYHLEYPVVFLRDLGRLTRRLLIVDTHITASPDAEDPDGYHGWWYKEDNHSNWAAVGNERSFWLSKDDLFRAMRDAGFSRIEEHEVPGLPPDRVMVSGVK